MNFGLLSEARVPLNILPLSKRLPQFSIMNSLLLLLCIPAAVYSIPSHSHSSPSYEVLYKWKTIDFQFPSSKIKSSYLRTGRYIPENNVVTGIKVYGSRVYLTTSRFRSGVPSTLNYVNLDIFNTTTSSPLLTPYPSWGMQEIGNCNALQFVQSMEVDRWGRMWIIDVGRDSILPRDQIRTRPSCPAKLLIIDLSTNKILHKHEFPASVINPSTNFFNDIVLECNELDRWSCWAYMSETWDSKVIIYSLAEDKSSFVYHASMDADPQAANFRILGNDYDMNMNINGIAISSKEISNHNRFYYAPLASYSIFSVLTSTLKQALRQGQTYLADGDVECFAKNRPSQTAGLISDGEGLLYLTQAVNNAISYFNITDPIIQVAGKREERRRGRRRGCAFREETVLIQDDIDIEWPDTFALDSHGHLYVTVNKLHKFVAGTLDFNDVNFRVLRITL